MVWNWARVRRVCDWELAGGWRNAREAGSGFGGEVLEEEEGGGKRRDVRDVRREEFWAWVRRRAELRDFWVCRVRRRARIDSGVGDVWGRGRGRFCNFRKGVSLKGLDGGGGG